MHPLLLKIGPVPIHTYGFLIALGFLASIFVIKRLSVRSGLDPERMVDFAFWSLIVGFIGARTLFVITRFSYFMGDPASIFKVWEGGLVFFGGPLAVLPFSWWYLKKHKLNYWKVFDISLPALTIAHVFGRFGCLSAGCCYGKPTGSNFGVRLHSDLVDRNLQGIPLHPTQLYEASALFILFLGLLYVFKRKAFDGQVGLTYFILYPIIRSIVEVYRGDLIRGFVIEDVISTSQFISIMVFVGALATLIFRLKRLHAGEPAMAVASVAKSGSKKKK